MSDREKQLILFGESTEKYQVKYKKVNSLSSRTTKFYGVLTGNPMLPGVGIGKAFIQILNVSVVMVKNIVRFLMSIRLKVCQ